ncbi:hypothetical protein EDB89DRAFT_2125053 [Lactarius sanguifluus]|nr:hypothetical protein EDB89DRAFT_2125053 [Lactarius sanguifluus]
MAHSTRIPLRFSNNVKRYFLSAPLRLDEGLHYRTLPPAHVSASPVWRATQSTPPPRIAWRPSPMHRSIKIQGQNTRLAFKVQFVQFRSGHVMDVSGGGQGRGFGHALLRATNSLVAAFVDKVAVRYASFNWRTVVLAVTFAAQEACHTTNARLGPSGLSAQHPACHNPLASGGCPSAGIYTGPFVYLLGPAPGVHRPFSVPSCFLLPRLWRLL